MNKNKRYFKSSVNIKFDLGKKKYFREYLPTPSHAESLQNILSGFNENSGKHSHIIIGPYGTGKSLLGTLISGMAAKSVNKSTFELLKKKFNKVDDEIYDQLTRFEKNEKKYLPVILNGNEGSFRKSIISAIMRTIEENELDIVVPGIINKILKIVDKWEGEFPRTYKEFIKLLKNSDRNIEIWKVNVLNFEKEEINWFKSIFPSLSSGAEFVIDYKEDFIEQIMFIIDELDKRNLGLLIVYDEFGRFLQSIETNLIHETMQDLQDLAELSDHYENHLHLLFITHKNLRHYFFKLSEEYQNEFQRIEKRFNLYQIDSDRSTFIRLTEAVLSSLDYPLVIPNVTESNLKKELRKYPLFANLNQVEIEKLVIKGAYPVHPVTMFVLPYMSSQFGQNERTLFTFLQSNEQGGLIHHIENYTNKFYLPDQLFDFFFPEIELDGRIECNSLQIYIKLLPKIPTEKENLFKLFKLISLWSIINLHSKQKLAIDFISFALNESKDYVEELLEELVKLKVIRFNRITGDWELFEGSSIDVEHEINNIKETTSITVEQKKKILEKTLSKKYFLANDYNDEKSMTRFSSVQITLSSELLDSSFDSLRIRNEKNSDAIVNYVILEDIKDREKVINLLKLKNDQNTFYCVSNKGIDEIKEDLINYYILSNLKSNTDFIRKDKDLLREITIKSEDLFHSLTNFMKSYSGFSSELVWIHEGKEIKIKNDIVLEKELSKLMFKKYPLTPEIRNDSFVRRKINSVQQKAGYKVVDSIIKDYNNEEFSIEGNGPDYLIYATIFKNNQLSLRNLKQIISDEFRSIRKDLIQELEINSYGNLSSLTNILKSEPYGLRSPLIPIILISLLRDKWDQLMFYRNKMYVPEITGEKLYQMVEEDSEYKFVYYNFDEKYKPLFQTISDVFGDYVSDSVQKNSSPILLSNGILNWLRQLPRFTQVTNNIDSNLKEFRSIVKRSEIDPKSSIDRLYDKYASDLSLFIRHKESLESHLNNYKRSLKNRLLNLIGCKCFKELNKWANVKNSIIKKNNSLVNGILNASEEDWIESIILTIVGVRIEDWSDTTEQMFEQLILKEYNSNQNELTQRDYLTISINGDDKAITKVDLSTKTQTIYKNIHRMIKNAGRNVSKEEVEYMIYHLVKEFVD
ncbi:hypothetical protein [Metabacillus arenae]|uniref:ATP-binding protein n=1 Tax=Metabacillus arenae TaxID=2771434 RepID=A0A926NIU6_9BACI|nr:hypothetical protein [Metabacillus arenae]MBD1381555.1 hypothetical protein [Metabacillus arenae]